MEPLPKERSDSVRFLEAPVMDSASMEPLPKERSDVAAVLAALRCLDRPQWSRSRRSGAT